MKVILTAEVKGKGHEGDVVEVARGYAVNYLLPRNMAIPATAGNLKQLDSRMSNISKRNAARRTDAEGIAEALAGKAVVIEAKAGDEGKLFGSVTTLMIEEAVAAQLGPDVDHRRMDLHHSIKTIGDHPVVVTIFGDVKAELIVRVVPEGGAAAAKAPAEPVAEPVVEAEETEDAEPEVEEVAETETEIEVVEVESAEVAEIEASESE
jgi:large subunit ribosomal protein L9